MLLPLSLSMDDGEAVDNTVAAVVVPLATVTAAAVVVVENEDGVQCRERCPLMRSPPSVPPL